MNTPAENNLNTINKANPETGHTSDIQMFDDLSLFIYSIKSETGLNFDVSSLLELNTDFINSSDEFLLLNIKEYGGIRQDNLLFLSKDHAYAFSNDLPSITGTRVFEDILKQPYGKSTVLCLIILNKIQRNHKNKLEELIGITRSLEKVFDSAVYHDITFEFERFSDRLEEFHDLILRLEERDYKEIEIQYIDFDYRVLIAQSQSLQGRCQRRFSMLRDIARDHETEVAMELNRRIEKLNVVLKRLTAITVILMLPTLIASHFGMNFKYMPEIHFPWAYPVVIIVQLMIIFAAVIIFKKMDWL